MSSDGQSVERLRDYLRTLKPEACAMLVAELERATLRGEGAGNELVLQELRRTLRGAGQPVKRIGDAARMFFAPVEPFLVDAAPDHRCVGRLARVSLDPIWDWIARDLMPAEVKALSEDINRALLADDRVKAEQLTRALHERAMQRIKETIVAARGEERTRRHLSVQVGTPRAVDDIDTLLRILAIRDLLADLARRLPNPIRAFEGEQIDLVRVFLDNAAAQKSSDPATAAARKADVFLYGLVLTINRLAMPWQLVRIATRAADSDNPGRIAETPYAVAVEIVLNGVECMVKELRVALKGRQPVILLLRSLHDAVRGLRTEMDLSVDSPWGRRLAAVRAEVSGLLKAEIESAPGRIRRLLRPHATKEIAPGSSLDAIDASEAEMLVEFVGACRNCANELAVNEVTMRAHTELRQYLESGTKALVETLRHAGDADRPFRLSQVDVAIKLCRIVFGGDYAVLLAKAADIAAQTGMAEHKTARA